MTPRRSESHDDASPTTENAEATPAPDAEHGAQSGVIAFGGDGKDTAKPSREDVERQIAAKREELTALEAQLATIPTAEYPQMVFHPSQGSKIVQTREEHQALGAGWTDRPGS